MVHIFAKICRDELLALAIRQVVKHTGGPLFQNKVSEEIVKKILRFTIFFYLLAIYFVASVYRTKDL